MVDNAFKNSKRLSWIRPPGKVILGLIAIDGVRDDLKFARELLEKREVITGPGYYFNEPGTIRIGIGAYSPGFDEAFARFLDFAETYTE
jgi:aspartate/methionine/tyrosine aminotransferase